MNALHLATQAELALAAYASGLSPAMSKDSLKDAMLEADMAEEQAGMFANGWTAIEQFNDPTGASATVFQDSDGKRYLAVRGTDSPIDLLTNGILATVGIPLLNPQYLALQSKVSEWLQAGVLPASFTVTGHSLGGYLAAALKSRFSEVSEAFMFNAPGDWGVLGTVDGIVQSLLPSGEPGAGGIWNIKGSEGLSLIAGLGSPQSTVIPVQIEPADNIIGNHSISRLVDALAVQSLYLELFPGATPAQINGVVNSAGAAGNKLEAALDSLRAIVLGPEIQPTSLGDREILYRNIYDVQKHASFTDLKTKGLTFIPMTVQTDMAAAAMSGDSAMQFALEALSPFKVSGLAFPSSPPRSSEYWTAREMLLKRKLWFSENDLNPATSGAPIAPEGGLPLHQFQAENTYFEDFTSGYKVSQGGPYDSATRYLFASDNGDALSGAGVADFLFGGEGADTLIGLYGSDLLEGYDGADVLDGGQGADILRGGSGDDWLGYTAPSVGRESSHEVGSAGNDYEGGEGNDHIAGSIGHDVYRYSQGDGRDVVSTNNGDDELLLENIFLEQAAFARTGNDLVIELPEGGAVTLRNWFDTANPQRLAFARFSDASLTEAEITSRVGIILTDGSDSFIGTNGADVIYGLGGNDSIHGDAAGSGNDRIFAGAGDDTVYGRGGNDQLYGNSGNDALYGGDGDDVLEGGDGNDLLDGGRGYDVLVGGSGNDTLGGSPEDLGSQHHNPGAGNEYHGGAGYDTLNGTVYSDTYYFNRGDGHDTLTEREPLAGWNYTATDILRFGQDVSPDDVTVRRIGNDLVLLVDAGADSMTVKNWFTSQGSTVNQLERIEFADGTLWLASEVTSRALVVMGTDGNDTVDGHAFYSNTLRGAEGNDTLYGGNLADLLYGEGGNDKLYGGDGSDLLEGGDGNDILDGGRGYDALIGGAGDDTLGGSGDIGSQHSVPGAGNEYRGGTGNDTLNGTGYSDLYYFDRGDGHDTLTEREPLLGWGAAFDVLRFGHDISPDGVTVRRVNNDLILLVDAGADSMTVKNWFTSQGSTVNQLERIEFADGTLWLASEVTSRALDTAGTAGNDVLNGHVSYSNTLRGLSGNDTLNGGNLADLLYGGSGNDTLNGASGDDLLQGDVGNDSLNGGSGNDVYRYFAGDGYDTVADTSGSADVLDFADLDFSAATFYRAGNDLEVSFGSGQGVLVKNQFANSSPVVELLLFVGQQYTASQVGALAGPRP